MYSIENVSSKVERCVHNLDYSSSSKALLLNSIFDAISSSPISSLITLSIRTSKSFNLVCPLGKGVFKGGGSGGSNPPPPKFSDFFLKVKEKR